MGGRNHLAAGLDIGTTKICTVVGEVNTNGIDIVGIGIYPSVGLRRGVVVNIESTVNSIKKAVAEAELMAGCEVASVYAGIAGGHIEGINSHGVIAIKSREVTQKDVDRVLDAARAVAIPMDREVIHILPQEYIVDDQDGIRDPLGMSGVRLEAKVHIVTGAVASAQNIVKCANRAGLDVQDIVLESLASSETVLTAEEKDLGVALIDFGGGTTDVAIFSENSIKHTSVLTLGGNHLTSDIAIGLRTPVAEAERVKINHGCCLGSLIEKDETIEVPGVGGRKPRILPRRILAEILEPRVEEVFELVKREITKAGCLDLMTSGVVVTGGSSLLPGVVEVAEQIFNVPARIGYPKDIGGLVDVVNNPIYATGVGLVVFGANTQPDRRFGIRDKNVFEKVLARMKTWFEEFF